MALWKKHGQFALGWLTGSKALPTFKKTHKAVNQTRRSLFSLLHLCSPFCESNPTTLLHIHRRSLLSACRHIQPPPARRSLHTIELFPSTWGLPSTWVLPSDLQSSSPRRLEGCRSKNLRWKGRRLFFFFFLLHPTTSIWGAQNSTQSGHHMSVSPDRESDERSRRQTQQARANQEAATGMCSFAGAPPATRYQPSNCSPGKFFSRLSRFPDSLQLCVLMCFWDPILSNIWFN